MIDAIKMLKIKGSFVVKQSLRSLKTTKPLKHSLYKILDPYADPVADGGFHQVQLSTIPGFDKYCFKIWVFHH